MKLSQRIIIIINKLFSKIIFVHSDPMPFMNLKRQIEQSPLYSNLFSKQEFGAIKWSHYSIIYDELLSDYRTQPDLKILEIGVQFGGSQRILKEYFNDSATIVGVDINENCMNLNTGTLIRIGSSRDRKFLESIVKEMGGVDIVIDDGSHRNSDQKLAFEILFPLISNNGMYIVEDLEHSYFWKSGGIPYLPNSFWNYAKRTTENLNKTFRKYPKIGTLKISSEELFSIKFYPQIIAFHKLKVEKPAVCIIGKQNL